MTKKKLHRKSSEGMALLLVMTIIVVVLGTITIGTTLLLNNLDESKGREDTEQALASAQTAIEKVKGYQKSIPNFLGACLVNDCIDFNSQKCISCGDPASLFTDGSRSYRTQITALNETGASLLATGYQGPYNRIVRDAIIFEVFDCGDPVTGLVTDQDAFEYKTVQIGDQCWFAENLKTRRKPDGTCINSGGDFIPPDCVTDSGLGGEKDSGRDCMRANGSEQRGDEDDCEEGYTLYRWATAMNDNLNGEQGICPLGWHIPNKSDKEVLIDNLGGDTIAGVELQIGGSSGFDAILTGDRQTDGDTFTSRDDWDCFWTTEEDGGGNAVYFCAEYKKNPIFLFSDSQLYSIAVRCIKDS